MSTVLACVDRSSYVHAVCDHAAWFAGPMQAEIAVLNADSADASPGAQASPFYSVTGDTPPGGPSESALARLEHEGVEHVRAIRRTGPFADAAIELAAEADLMVMGKRGADSDGTREILGANVGRVLRGTERPVCLVSKVFLPIARALVILDADPTHERTVRTLAAHPALSGLEVDLVMMGEGGKAAEAKLAWARELLHARAAAAFALPADGPDEAAALYMQSRRCDMLVMSREVVIPDPQALLREVQDQSIWAWRTPLLIC